jgi:glutamate decarboxylase
MLSKKKKGSSNIKTKRINSRYAGESTPKVKLDDHERSPRLSYELIHDEMFFEANPRLNMATFVTTYMEPEAEKLMMEAFDKNFIDKPIYPQTLEIQDRCVSIISDLFNAGEDAAGVATVGSSEAIHLAGLTMKWNWREWYRKKFNKEPEKMPNIIMGSNVQVCWEKFCKYFDVNLIEIPLNSEYKMDIQKAVDNIDDYTIGVVGILGNTYSGEFDEIEDLNDLINIHNKENDRQVPIHVDAASGGFVAPFTDVHKDVVWDFRLKWVYSINVSGHKYGMVYPGVGWAIWKSADLIPDDLIFHVKYLGEDQQDFGLNFSRGASQIVAQYYNFVRYGKKGYKRIMDSLMAFYDDLKESLLNITFNDGTPIFELISHDKGLPLVAVKLTDEALKKELTLERISLKARQRGWVFPVYPLAEPYEDTQIMRIVIREGFNIDMLAKIIEDIEWAIDALLDIIDELGLTSNGAHGVC